MSISKFYNLAKNKLYPLNRSLTGKGVVETLEIIKKEFSELQIKKIKSGTKVFDWTIPPEWNVSDAYILDKYNNKIIDFKINNLHLVGYSIPVKKYYSKKELIRHLHFYKKQPNSIPYITSYYKRAWGFCLTYNQYKNFNKSYSSDDTFKVIINSNLNKEGNLNYGELILKGESKKEIFISTYICHPSMANNELSGPIVSMGLINYFKNKKKLKKTLRFVFIPETIGSISYINKNIQNLKNNVIGGYNLSCIGDERNHSCMFSKYGNSPSDEALEQAYKSLKIRNYKIHSFLERGSDERQYNSPGVDLKISSIFRTQYGKYSEYHSSLDDFKLVTVNGCQGGYNVARKSIEIMLKKIYPESKLICEPFMSKRGLRSTLSKKNTMNMFVKEMMDFLQYSDGTNSIENIAIHINLKLSKAYKIYYKLKKEKLVY